MAEKDISYALQTIVDSPRQRQLELRKRVSIRFLKFGARERWRESQ